MVGRLYHLGAKRSRAHTTAGGDASPWHWYLSGEPLKNGLQVGDSLLLLAVTAVLVAAGTWVFNRRDVAV